MSRQGSLLVFAAIEIVLLPVIVVGVILFSVNFVLRLRESRTSATAYDPFFARYILHAQNKRRDEANKQLLYALPTVSPLAVNLMLGPTLLAMRTTGVTTNMYDYPVYSSSSIWGAFGHRTRFFDDALRDHLGEAEQVVILGAGWDTRSYNLVKGTDAQAFEVDAPETQTQKRESLAAANIDASDVVFAAADFNEESWLDALERVGFDPSKPTFVLWEGVTYYLEAEAVEATLKTVAEQLAPGSAIAFDYPARHIVEGNTSLIYRMATLAARLIGEPWTFGISTEAPAREQLAKFLERNGLRLAEYEPVGEVEGGERPHGGLAVAVNE
ncbi:class I SAM-dependent methyltransferase [Rubrobacter aplysinae]|uniref:class I SAM-dependent methyltransferase n=1 Tax=Rubrobacter aplysinae TaxID=909625 RepID=UPI00069DAB0E|nr:SAM-dependent methyltransferase [Rubrobacter aplysinae]